MSAATTSPSLSIFWQRGNLNSPTKFKNKLKKICTLWSRRSCNPSAVKPKICSANMWLLRNICLAVFFFVKRRWCDNLATVKICFLELMFNNTAEWVTQYFSKMMLLILVVTQTKHIDQWWLKATGCSELWLLLR